MKPWSTILVAIGIARTHVVSSTSTTPIERTVQLIADLKAKVVADGKAEQASFDEYACWCEDTLERKSAAISAAKELIAETDILIKKLKGEIASHGAEIAQLKKDISQNKAAVKEASDVRHKEYEEYHAEKLESEQCIGALESAIKVLTGAGTGKGFLDTTAHKAQLLSVAAQVRTVLRAPPHSVSQEDLDAVKSFIAKPEDFLASHASAMSAAQVKNNPFGDYAPQSTQIQGILKGMYDAFTADLEKDNAGEAESQKSFEELMATKLQELETLQATLQKQESDEASKTKQLKESEVLKDDTVEQLKADEAFFADTKEACQTKASEWSTRTRLRTEEIHGMDAAIKVLTSESAQNIFANATTTFLQLKSIQKHNAKSGATKAYGRLKTLASQFHNLGLARIAVAVKNGGHFDKVIGMIDDMIGLLRKEEQEDIEHRDICENNENANKNELDDLGHEIDKADDKLGRMGNKKTEVETEITAVKSDISATKKSQEELLEFRNKEEAEFRQALKDDTDAVALIREAIKLLSKFYKDNKIPLELAQESPEYTHDPDKAPDTIWSGADYGGRKSESQGILAILEMLAEDLEKEIADARADDADAQAKYEKQNGALQETLDAQEQSKVSLEEELSGLEDKMEATEEYKKGKKEDEDAEDATKQALATDCAWVKSHFESRREKRKNEIQGLVEAKGYLAGVDAGEDDILPP
mmetsp:Transcript_121795/g.191182  ORF Transcript_121795/g.191182 Transcript_121795/m.191182 type:complete len:704 (-) Transcript_121795:78-2189(-)|eukprot:CAMPEP_0169099698 /NCGR_PEP_ID=MMETSP1015-20121227/20695_1 /TAXON_ID=342587 /ORGANISM="Karlodinium micrum, Strain CCMP2283" /LENGTH=703 /DNA_ID=CAMNT_0009160595 /DNA_START=63 /DNA_END=2177 /DNA_ORIENTATION=+